MQYIIWALVFLFVGWAVSFVVGELTSWFRAIRDEIQTTNDKLDSLNEQLGKMEITLSEIESDVSKYIRGEEILP